MLTEIKRIIKEARIDEKAFAQRLMEQIAAESDTEAEARTASLTRLRERDSTIDRHVAKLYVDSAEGRISDGRMAKLMD